MALIRGGWPLDNSPAQSALSPSRCRLPAIIARRQRYSRFKALELDPRTGTSPQQPVRRLTQSGTTFERVMSECGVEGCEEGCDIAVDSLAQRLIDERIPFLCPVRLAYHANRRAISGWRIWGGTLPTNLDKALLTSPRPDRRVLMLCVGAVSAVVGERQVQSAPRLAILTHPRGSKRGRRAIASHRVRVTLVSDESLGRAVAFTQGRVFPQVRRVRRLIWQVRRFDLLRLTIQPLG